MLTCPASRDRTSRGDHETHAGSVAALISRDDRYDARLNWQVMRFKIATEPWILRGYIPELVELAGQELWRKRATHFRSFGRSPYLARIASDYHWVELQLDDELAKRQEPTPPKVAAEPIASRALRFAQTIVEVYRSLPPVGQRQLEGRIRDALHAETGFAALYQEMEIATVLINQNFDVRFPDLENMGRADISFQQGAATGLIECKALSADAGRKIHRKHFYRFMDAISQEVLDRMSASCVDELIMITLKDRLPSNLQYNTALVQATRNLLRSSGISHAGGDDFNIVRKPYSTVFDALRPLSEREFYAEAHKQFGPNCHIAGGRTEGGGCLILMRSERQDDHSKPQLEAMKEATEQLPADRPGFIALQFNEISSADLALPHLRERCALLSDYLFHEALANHVAAVYICAFGALSVAADATAYPAIVIWNPQCKFDCHGLPFRVGVRDAVFAELVNAEHVDPPVKRR